MSAQPAVVDLGDPAFWQHPHPVMAAAREAGPVAFTQTGMPMIVRYAELERILRSPLWETQAMELLSQHGINDGPLYEWWRLAMFNTNGAEHSRLRTLVAKAFTPKSVEELRPVVATLTNEILDRHVEVGSMEIVEDLAHELPIRVLVALLGVPDSDHELFDRWTTDLGYMFSEVMTPELHDAALGAVNGLNSYIEALIADRRAHPRDDLLSSLIAAEEAGDRLSEEELVAIVINILFGGHDTSKSMFGIAFALLLTHQDQLRLLRGRPDHVPTAIDEVLRYEPPFNAVRRPTSDIQVGDVTIPAGTLTWMSLLAGNHDPGAFRDPERFDVTRSESRILSFGYGIHYCLGAALARMDAQEAIPIVLDRLPGLELTLDEPRWVPFLSIRRIESLPVTFNRA
jgi:cytochrome P450